MTADPAVAGRVSLVEAYLARSGMLALPASATPGATTR